MDITLPDEKPAADTTTAVNIAMPDEGDSLRANYDAASRVDPGVATETIRISKQTGIQPGYAAKNINEARAIAATPSPEFFVDIQDQHPSTAAFLSDATNMAKTHDDLVNLAAHEPVIKQFRYAHNFGEALAAGLQGSLPGLALRGEMPDIGLPDDAPMTHRLAAQAGGLAGDLPFMAFSGAAAAETGPVGAMAAAFAFPAALKKALTQRYLEGDVKGATDLLRRVYDPIQEGLTQGAIGALTGEAGQIAGGLAAGSSIPLASTVAPLAAEAATMTTASKAVEGELPSPADLAEGMIVMGGMHALGAVPTLKDITGSITKSVASAAEAHVHALDQLAIDSKWRSRDPQGYAEHVDSMSPPVLIPLDAFEKTFKNPEIVADQLGIADAYAEAKSAGTDVQVPMGTFLSAALDKHRADLAKDVKFSDGPNAKTVNQIDEEAKAAAEKPSETTAPAASMDLTEETVAQVNKAAASAPPESVGEYKIGFETGAGDDIADVVARDAAGNKVGWFQVIGEKKDGSIHGDVFVEKNNRRQGIASAMYKFAEKHIGRKITPSALLTDEGAALWRSFGVSSDPQIAEREIASRAALDQARAEVGQGQQESLSPDVPPEVAAVQARLEKAAAKEAEELLLAPQIAEMKRDAAAEREKLTTQAEAEVGQDPLYEAQDSLRRGIGIGQDTFTEAPVRNAAQKFVDGKLDDGKQLLFETAAEQHGFSSGDELAKAILSRPAREDAIKALVESRATKDLRQTPEMRAEALKALHGEKSAELLALKAEIMVGLARRTARDAAFVEGIHERARIAAEQAKFLARKMIADKPVEEAGRYQKYYTAERNAAVRAAKAAAKGDFEEASKALNQQLAAHAMAAESARARERIDRWTSSLVKLQKADKTSYRSEEHFAQAASILGRFGFQHAEFDPSSKVEALGEWVARMEDQGHPVAIPEWIENEAVSKSWRKLTVSELHDVRDAVKNIKHIAANENKMLLIRRGEQIEALSQALHDAKMASGASGKAPGAGTYQSAWQKIVRMKDAVRQALISPESLFTMLDKFRRDGPWRETFIESKSAQENIKGEMMAEAGTKWKEIHSAYSEKELRDMDSKPIHVPEFQDSLTKNDLITMWMHQGTEGNQAKLLAVARKGVRWTQEMVDAVLDREMTKRDCDLGQARIDLIGSFRPKIGELYKRLAGFEPDWVEPQKIHTKFGEYAGGYSPLAADPRVTVRGFEEMKNDEALTNPTPTWKASTRNGFIKTRNENARYALSLDSHGIVRHIADVIHDLTMREWVIDSNRILGNKDVQADLVDALGMPQFQSLKNWAKQIAGNDTKPLRGAIEMIMGEVRRRSTIAQLGGKITAMLNQLDVTVAAGVDPKNLGVHQVVGSILGAYGNMLKDPSSVREMVDFVHENSAYMRQRQHGVDRDLLDAARATWGHDPKLLKAANYGFALLDRIIVTPIWREAYKVGLKLNEGEHAKAVAYADEIIRNSNAPGRRSDLPEIMRSSELGALFTMYHGQIDRQAQLMYRAFGRAEGVRDVPQFIGTAMNVMLVPSLVYALTHYGLPTTAEKRKKWMKSVLQEPLQDFPIISTMADIGLDAALKIKGGSSSITPAAGMLDAYKEVTGKAISRRANNQQRLESATKLASYVTPYPDQFNAWMWNTVDYVRNGMEPRAGDILRRRPIRERHGAGY